MQQVCEEDDEDDDEDDADDNAGSCDFVYEYISKNCPNEKPCVPQPCANFPLCGNAQPKWLIECKGGICIQPCDMEYGRIFDFSRFALDDACPVCLEQGAVSVVYACKHMVCATCYGKAAFDAGKTLLLERCPVCRHESVPLGTMRPRWNAAVVGAATVDYVKPT